LLSRASSKAGKKVYLRRRLQTYCIARYSSRSVFAFSAFRNISFEAIFLFHLGESEKKDMSLDSKTPTTPRMTISRLSSKKVPFLKASCYFSCLHS